MALLHKSAKPRDTNGRVNDFMLHVIEQSLEHDHSQSRDDEARRLRILYARGAAGDSVDEPVNHHSLALRHPPATQPTPPTAACRRRSSATPWYTSGSGMGSTASLAARTRYDARAEVAARRGGHLVSHLKVRGGMPIDEYVPKLMAGAAGSGYLSGPRVWPSEAEYTASEQRKPATMSGRHMPHDRPSYARETTVAGAASGLSDLQMALSGRSAPSADVASAVMRGTQRGEQKATFRQAALVTEALEERQAIQHRHAKWLESSGSRRSRDHNDVKRSTYAQDLGLALGVPAAPSTVFREAMRQGGAGQRTRDLARGGEVKCLNNLAAVVLPAHETLFHEKGHALGRSDAAVEKALARKLKARALRFDVRPVAVADVLHALHRSPSAKPGNQQIARLHAALRICGTENSNPMAIGRSQFLTIAQRTFEDFRSRPQLLQSLYSAFDPDARDRARYDTIAAGLVLANRPDLYKLLGNLGSETHGARFSALQPMLKEVLALFGAGRAAVAVTANDVRDILLLPALSEDDAITLDGLWTDTAATLFDLMPRDRQRTLPWSELWGTLSTSGEALLLEFERQVLAFQAIVKNRIIEHEDNKEH